MLDTDSVYFHLKSLHWEDTETVFELSFVL